eukprot:TRINITY_DN4427_c0_g1_i1.p1 TRINITY_DN4427_c0_g1~~TRINITY_DN4427_c0_g1_i1.p1  ORF type:complete len:239 (+),score=48.72 TRINITY_DN4427_c0_g1_i1:93-809(+)
MRRVFSSAAFRRPAPVVARTTTILTVRRDNLVVMMGDGRATSSSLIVKDTSVKIRKVGNVLVGFAGEVADAISLLDVFSKKLSDAPDNLLRAAVELAKTWRGSVELRRLNASILVANKAFTLEINGEGDVIRAESDVHAVGSGGAFAYSAATALHNAATEGVTGAQHLTAEDICRRSMRIAVSMDAHSGGRLMKETVDANNLAGDGSDLPEGHRPEHSGATWSLPEVVSYEDEDEDGE